MEGCVFCEQQNGLSPVVGGAIYSDDLVYASHRFDASAPTYLGYIAVQSRRHVHHWADLTDAEASAIGLLITRLSRALKACLGVDHTYVVYYAEVVPHLHVLLTARYPDMPKEYWRGKIYDWPAAPKGGVEEVTQLCDTLRKYLTNPS
ncbi:MAG TPA: HIT domain-containing protein [Chthonomonadaceae bacterium]|nr:HIT domain-containing protein [Chthonomonadaceae bacterium]